MSEGALPAVEAEAAPVIRSISPDRNVICAEVEITGSNRGERQGR